MAMPYPNPDDLFEIVCNLVALYPREYQLKMEERAKTLAGKEADESQRVTINVILAALKAHPNVENASTLLPA